MAKTRGISYLTRFLKFLDYVLILAGGAIVAAIFYIEHTPTLTVGWLVFGLGVLVFLAGLTGLPSKNTGRQSCFGCHTLALLLGALTAGGTGALLLLQKSYVVRRLKPASLSPDEVDEIIVYGTYALLAIGGVCLVSLIMSCSIMRCLIPAKQKFWHDDYTYRQRALAFYEMKEEADVEEGKRGRAKYSKEDPEKPELLGSFKRDQMEHRDTPAGSASTEV